GMSAFALECVVDLFDCVGHAASLKRAYPADLRSHAGQWLQPYPYAENKTMRTQRLRLLARCHLRQGGSDSSGVVGHNSADIDSFSVGNIYHAAATGWFGVTLGMRGGPFPHSSDGRIR
ncbi:MAG: hypothetical protein ACKVKT_06335, partial [Rhodospirillales bacterium]